MTAVAREATIAETATLVHGFTMADVDRAAKVSDRKAGMRGILSSDDREHVAWSAIVEKLYACGCGTGLCRRVEELTFPGLVTTGMNAVLGASNDQLRSHGFFNNGEGEGPSFSKYWRPIRGGRDDGFTEKLCERLSLRSALATLTPSQYEAISTLAAFDNDHTAAARALGKEVKTFRTLVYQGRRRIEEVWYEGETPPRRHIPGETCLSGHRRADHGVLRSTGVWDCRVCHRNRSRRFRAKGAQ